MQEGLQVTEPAACLFGAVVTRRPKALVADHTSFLTFWQGPRFAALCILGTSQRLDAEPVA